MAYNFKIEWDSEKSRFKMPHAFFFLKLYYASLNKINKLPTLFFGKINREYSK